MMADGSDGRTPLRVLIIEDYEDARESLGLLLHLYGYDVELAADGSSALRAAQDRCPDVVLLDLGLPDMDGYETARRLRQQCAPKQPVVAVVSGYGRQEDLERSRAEGIPCHFLKPVEPPFLLQWLAQTANQLRRGEPVGQRTQRLIRLTHETIANGEIAHLTWLQLYARAAQLLRELANTRSLIHHSEPAWAAAEKATEGHPGPAAA